VTTSLDEPAGMISEPPLKVRPVRRPGRWVATALVAILVALLIRTLITNPNYEWSIVAKYMTNEAILKGLLVTIEISAISMGVGIVLGTILALMRLSPNPILSSTSWAYIWFFRGTPLLVQLIFWFNLSALYPSLSLGIPFGPTLVSGSANDFITPFTAAILGLSLNEGAYMSEIVRAGILSVDQGQHEAARSIGMSTSKVMRRIVLPQAMRVIIPPTGNQAIGMLKTSSLVSVISLADLLYSAEIIYASTYQTVPLLIVASLWYLIVCSIMMPCQYYIERHYSKGSTRELPPTPVQRVLAFLRRHRLTQRKAVP